MKIVSSSERKLGQIKTCSEDDQEFERGISALKNGSNLHHGIVPGIWIKQIDIGSDEMEVKSKMAVFGDFLGLESSLSGKKISF
jgi:hypothetical protein